MIHSPGSPILLAFINRQVELTGLLTNQASQTTFASCSSFQVDDCTDSYARHCQIGE